MNKTVKLAVMVSLAMVLLFSLPVRAQMVFCGDWVCSAPFENAYNCPYDCCQVFLTDDGICGPCENEHNSLDCNVCGSGYCAYGEDPYSCFTDCPGTCGDHYCSPTENETNCHADCPDLDRDRMPSWWESSYACLNPAVADGSADPDGDGLSNFSEFIAGTNPCDPDTDHDGLNDKAELTDNTSPTDWDTDHDYLPDKFEVDNRYHTGNRLNARLATDAALDFDGDGNSNLHEYWNGSNLWAVDPVPPADRNPGCYYWGDADGDGYIGPGDMLKLQLEIAGVPQAYPNILPHTRDTIDLDKDGTPGPGDRLLLVEMMVGNERLAGFPSSPAELAVVSSPAAGIAVGATTHVTLSLHNASGLEPHGSGFGVVFWIDPASPGAAALLGGEGTALGEPTGNRYDVAMEAAAGGRANIVLRITQPGAITIRAKVPVCGDYPYGRWNDEVLAPAIVINGP
jgi:hypothetical protein